jgi:iron complex outermembrane receptor protein
MNKKQLLASVFIGAFAASGALADADAPQSSNIGTIQVQGIGNDAAAQPGTGLIIPEDSPKAKSTATKAYIEELRPTSNPYQMLMMLPGVNQHQDDAYGLSGGTLSVRGFSSAQMGVTIEGVPVNDSGNYAIYPQEYTDAENFQEIYITQGATDSNAPHVGASGGNIVMTMITPSDKFGGMVDQSYGMDSFWRSFARVESGLLDSGTKFFISGSTAYAHKWRGAGDDERSHADFKLVQKIGSQSDFTFVTLFNYAVNDFYFSLSKAQYSQFGRKFDYDRVYTPNDTNYYKLHVNPFENVISSAAAHLQLADDLRATIQPYIWYGFGNGTSATTMTQGAKSPTDAGSWGPVFLGNVVNIPGYASGAKVTLLNPSITETYRPGVQTFLDYKIANQTLSGGFWWEDARHVQTAPYSPVDANGNPVNVWGQSQMLTDPATGAPLQRRNQITQNKVYQEFVQDDALWFNDHVRTVVAVRHPSLTRDGTNMENGVLPQDRHLAPSYDMWLPTVGVNYEFIQYNSVYADYTKNFRAPQNYALFDNPPNPNGQRPETSDNYELGYRYQDPKLIAQIVGFYNLMHNRQATAIDPLTQESIDTNIGTTKTEGVEFQSGYELIKNLSLFASATYNETILQDNFVSKVINGQNAYLPTAGKTYIDTPKWMYGASAEYANVGSGLFGGVQAKWTGKRYATLVNDENVGGFLTVDLHAGYHFGDVDVLKDPVLLVNATNLFDRHYLGEIATYQNNLNPVASSAGVISGSTPFYHIGAPRTVSVTLSSKF